MTYQVSTATDEVVTIDGQDYKLADIKAKVTPKAKIQVTSGVDNSGLWIARSDRDNRIAYFRYEDGEQYPAGTFIYHPDEWFFGPDCHSPSGWRSLVPKVVFDRVKK